MVTDIFTQLPQHKKASYGPGKKVFYKGIVSAN